MFVQIVIRTVSLMTVYLPCLGGDRKEVRELVRNVGWIRIKRDKGDIGGKRDDRMMDGTLQRKSK